MRGAHKRLCTRLHAFARPCTPAHACMVTGAHAGRYAGGFSIAMCCRLIIFLPAAAADARGTLARGVAFAPRAAASTGLVAITTGVMLAIHRGIDSHGGAFLLLALFYFQSIAAPWGDLGAPVGGKSASAGKLAGNGGAYGPLQLPEQSFAIGKALAFVLLVVFFPLGATTSFALGIAALIGWGPLASQRVCHRADVISRTCPPVRAHTASACSRPRQPLRAHVPPYTCPRTCARMHPCTCIRLVGRTCIASGSSRVPGCGAPPSRWRSPTASSRRSLA